ncbi:MAG: hypothetical protein Q7I97_03260 [Thermovirgaceae bacterium]|nr:hypothetical protein [Thermovirgaceae bacterium]
MAARRSVLIFLTILLLVVPVAPAQASPVPDAARVSLSADAGGLFAWFLEFARGIFTTQPPAGNAGENDGDGVFSKNPYVYVAAFWSEIINAPKERAFFERIMAFLGAVRVRRSRIS